MSQSDLHAALTAIDGIGDARADEVLDTLAEFDRGVDDSTDREIAANLQQAREHHAAGNHAYAAKYVERAASAADTTE